MTSSSPAKPTDPPECPVCLEPFNHSTTIPRVLSCGHSTCETCLTQLPFSLSSSLSHAIRCPSCTQLVKIPHPQGPSALPKNIDLLRFSLSSPKPHNKKSAQFDDGDYPKRGRFGFPHEIWDDGLYGVWKDWILPNWVVLVEKEEKDGQVFCFGRVNDDLGFVGFDGFDVGLCSFLKCLLIEGQKVGLVEIGCFGLVENEGLFEYSYVGKIMRVLGCMSDGERRELGSILRVSLRDSRVCVVYGLWLDLESGCLYLVTERKNDEFFSLGNLGDGVGQECEGLMSCLSSIGVELCEVLVGLRLQGFVCGCLSVSCFKLDDFGHVHIDLSEVLVAGRKIRECVVEVVNGRGKMDSSEVEELVMKMFAMDVFVSPEVLWELLRREGVEVENNGIGFTFDYSSDVWLLACVLFRLLIGKQFAEGMYNYLRAVFEPKNEEVSECKIMYLQWVEMINGTMSETRMGSESLPLQEILLKCLDLDPGNRPLVTDVWKSFKGRNTFGHIDHVAGLNGASMEGNALQCMVLGELCMSNYSGKESIISKLSEGHYDCEPDPSQVGEMSVDDAVGRLSASKVRSKDLQGHLDCITGLCVGGGFLFSSSFDKTVQVWSLQDFTHVHTFRGHEQRVMAVVYVDQEKPLCISADSGGGIFSWEVMVPFGQEPLKKWYEEKDWRYSGIHALAISESGYLYTGSGDRLIKAWSLRDYTLMCNMEGHKSVVSALALCNGVLYSGSWDGTVRLWCLHDHSPLAVFGEDSPGAVSSVVSLHADQDTVIAAHENGCIKIWMNDMLKASKQVHGGAIFALAKEGKWMFTGGWDKIVKIQEMKGDALDMDTRGVGSIACDSVVTALLYVRGILFVGHANRLIKAYHSG